MTQVINDIVSSSEYSATNDRGLLVNNESEYGSGRGLFDILSRCHEGHSKRSSQKPDLLDSKKMFRVVKENCKQSIYRT